MNDFTTRRIRGFEIQKFNHNSGISCFSKIKESRQFWTANESFYNKENSRFRNSKIQKNNKKNIKLKFQIFSKIQESRQFWIANESFYNKENSRFRNSKIQKMTKNHKAGISVLYKNPGKSTVLNSKWVILQQGEFKVSKFKNSKNHKKS